MLRQRQQDTKSKKSKTPLRESASQTKTKTGISTSVPETSGDPQDPSLSRLRSTSSNVTPSQPSSQAALEEAAKMDMQNMSRKSQWLILAVASGACAAFNGVFAKLTTTELTTSFATSIANLLGLGKGEKVVEVIIRAMFFGLNLIFNGIMWTLFTKALARGTSTTQVSIINTSANFMITAVLGFMIFSESLPPLWWLGAALLVAGNVIIGRREEAESAKDGDDLPRSQSREDTYADEDDILLNRESVELNETLEPEGKRTREQEDILQLNLDEEEAR